MPRPYPKHANLWQILHCISENLLCRPKSYGILLENVLPTSLEE